MTDMPDQRFIIEMGTGTDLHGRDYTKAARRAVESALRGASLHILGLPGLDLSHLRLRLTLGVQDPSQVDPAALAPLFPVGTPEIVVTHGGLDVTHPVTGDTAVTAIAAIEVFLPPQTAAYRPA